MLALGFMSHAIARDLSRSPLFILSVPCLGERALVCDESLLRPPVSGCTRGSEHPSQARSEGAMSAMALCGIRCEVGIPLPLGIRMCCFVLVHSNPVAAADGVRASRLRCTLHGGAPGSAFPGRRLRGRWDTLFLLLTLCSGCLSIVKAPQCSPQS